MTTLQRCIDFLDSKRIHYTHSTHPIAYRAHDVAAAEHLPAYILAKTVVFCGDNCYAMAVLPADCEVDLEELATTLGLRRVRLATEREIGKLFPDSELGAMPPLGALFNLPVYVDRRLATQKHIVFNAGSHRDAIHMSFVDYARLAAPLITHFAQPEIVNC
jgi:Ala-tRNA(Pro) deacylase